jgi:hypothetical protein
MREKEVFIYCMHSYTNTGWEEHAQVDICSLKWDRKVLFGLQHGSLREGEGGEKEHVMIVSPLLVHAHITSSDLFFEIKK